MLEKLALYVLAIISCYLFVHANNALNVSSITLDDKDSIKISLLPESEGPIQVSDADKPILRYGFHRTHDCNNFEKAFICVRKCLDLDYQIAHADKNCICTCYKNTILAKYKPPLTGSAKWKLGAPTTSLPPWAGGGGPKSDDYEINTNYTEFIKEITSKDAKGDHTTYIGNANSDHPATADGDKPDAVQDAMPAKADGPADATPAHGETAAEDAVAEAETPAATIEGDDAASPAPSEGDAPAEAPPA